MKEEILELQNQLGNKNNHSLTSDQLLLKR